MCRLGRLQHGVQEQEAKHGGAGVVGIDMWCRSSRLTQGVQEHGVIPEREGAGDENKGVQ